MWWGIGFLVSLLVSAGMASVPTGDDTTSVVRSFYVDNQGIVVTAQLIGLVAAFAFLMFSRRLASVAPGTEDRGRLQWTGVAVAAGAAVTAVPPMWLALTASDASTSALHDLARASDLTDVLLFAAIASFAGAVTFATSSWLRPVAVVVGVVCLAQAVMLVIGADALEAVAPLAFVALVVILIVRVRSGGLAPVGPESDR